MRLFISNADVSIKSFNPRICKRCDTFCAQTFAPRNAVSIHASVKDATQQTEALLKIEQVSIHASVKDATVVQLAWAFGDKVSIHASVKDATIAAQDSFYQNRFNPRICKRCDDYIHITDKYGRVSIHASVKDATNGSEVYAYGIESFNPRICKRCDSMFVKNFIDDTFKL